MKALYEVKENATSELKVTVDGQEWTDAQAKAKKKIASKVEIKGFRKGHVPAAMVEKAINAQQVMYEAAEEIAQSALEFGLKEYKDIKLIDRPALDIESITETEVTLKFILAVYPTVSLGDYKAVEYKLAKVSVSKKEVDEEIKKLQERNAEEVLKEEGTVNSGDIAVIDFEGFVDGVAFEGGKGTEYPLEIGSGSFIPGFEDQLIGMSTGEEKDVNVTFPKEYTKELAGKAATFKVKVCGIKEKKLPELNDAFAAECKYGEEVKTMDDLTKAIKENLKHAKTHEAEEEATNNLLTGLCDCCKVDIPEVMIKNEVEDSYQNYVARLQQQGIGMDMYYQITGSNEEQLKESLKGEAEKKVRIRLVLDAIGSDMKVEVSDAELNEEYEAMAKQYQMEVEKIKQLIPENYLSEDVKMRKTLDTLKKTEKAA